jgi:molybdopterin molybdotransferase
MRESLMSVEGALELVLERVSRLPAEEVPLRDALGRVLAEEIVAPEAVPGFDNSAMDGYAVRAADTAGAGAQPRALRIAAEARAGHPAEIDLAPGEAIEISTGAMVPVGADAIVRVEDTERVGEGVRILAEVEPGRNLRRAGEDIRAGARLLGPGRLIGAADAGVLASAARPEVSCAQRPRVSVVVSGDELIGPDEAYRPGAVRDSNAYTVPALAELSGAAVESIEHVGDDPAQTRDALERALLADVAVVCGGVSVGPHDHVKGALRDLGAEKVFWGVALRPGKPTWFGQSPSGGLAFGLPGNPVSAMVTFILFARPALLAMQGRAAHAMRSTATLAEGHPSLPDRDQAVRCSLSLEARGWVATPTGAQGSHVLTSMLGADGLAILPASERDAAAGDRFDVELLRPPTIVE